MVVPMASAGRREDSTPYLCFGEKTPELHVSVVTLLQSVVGVSGYVMGPAAQDFLSSDNQNVPLHSTHSPATGHMLQPVTSHEEEVAVTVAAPSAQVCSLLQSHLSGSAHAF